VLFNDRLRIWAYARLTTLEEVKRAIFAQGGVWAGVQWHRSWFTPAADGTLPPPSGPIDGGHAIWFVGYDDARGAFHFVNSWGTRWGARGYGWLPYDYFTLSGDNYDSEAWSITDAPDCIITVEPFATPRRWQTRYVAQRLSSYLPSHPGSPVKTARFLAHQLSPCRRSRAVQWVGMTAHVPGGYPFLRVSDGVFAGQLVVEANVRLDPL